LCPKAIANHLCDLPEKLVTLRNRMLLEFHREVAIIDLKEVEACREGEIRGEEMQVVIALSKRVLPLSLPKMISSNTKLQVQFMKLLSTLLGKKRMALPMH
jgi:hypothetical protein